MMSFLIKELVKQRRSVRTFDGRVLTDEDRKYMTDLLSSLENPWGISIEFFLLNAKQNGLTSPVIIGAEEYIAAKTERVPHFEIAFGYSFEKACIYALSRGIGTVMLAASLNRTAFEKAINIGENEVMPVASPIGYPADKMSIRESLMRKGIKADSRKPFESIFFNRTFDNGLDYDNAGVFANALEAVRLAPSAANGQPWRTVSDGTCIHFYEAKSMKDSPLGDIQKVDIGIALANFDLVREEDGINGKFEFADPGIATPQNTQYIVTFRRQI